MIETLSETTEIMPSDYIALKELIDKAWSDLADYVFNPERLFLLLDEIVHNPLCIAVSCALCVVFGFRIFSNIVSMFRSRS